MKKENLRHYILLIIISVIISGCSKPEIPTQDLIPRTSAIAVTTDIVRTISTEPVLTSFGSISFKRKTDLSCAVDGIIREIYKEEGDFVREGTLLALIGNTQLLIKKQQAEMEVLSSKAAYRLSETKYQEGRLQVEARLLSHEKTSLRIALKEAELTELAQILDNKEKLFEVDGISEEELKSLQLNYLSSLTEFETMKIDNQISLIGLRDSDIIFADLIVPETSEERKHVLIDLNTRTLKAELEVAQTKINRSESELSSINLLLKDLEIRANESSIIGVRYLEKGERVTAGTKLFTIFDNTEVYATFPIQESSINLIEVGQEVKINIKSMADKEFSGIISIVSPTIDPQSGNLSIKALISNPENILIPGLFANITVHTGKPINKKMIPVNTIVSKRGKIAEVFTVVNNRTFLKEIKVGSESNSYIEVLSGLINDEILVTNPAPLLREGSEIEM